MLVFQQPPGPPGSPPTTAPAPGGGAQPSTPQPAAPSPAVPRVFGSELGIIFNAVKPDKVADFEMILGRLRQALEMSEDPVRREQAPGWKIFKAGEPGPSGSVLYLFVLDPAVKGADYGVARILAEAFPGEAQALYKTYIGALSGGQTLLNLNPVPTTPVTPPPAPTLTPGSTSPLTPAPTP